MHRARYVGPTGAQARGGAARHGRASSAPSRQARLAVAARCSCPDENVTWNLTAIPAAIRIVRERGHRRRAHDLAAELGAPDRRGGEEGDGRALGRRPARLARRAPAPARRARSPSARRRRREHAVARLVARQADAIVTVSDAIAEEARALEPRGARGRRSRTAATSTTSPGSSTTAATASGSRTRAASSASATRGRSCRRSPTPTSDVVARFVGDFRAADREFAETLELGDRLELHPVRAAPRARSSSSATPTRCCC